MNNFEIFRTDEPQPILNRNPLQTILVTFRFFLFYQISSLPIEQELPEKEPQRLKRKTTPTLLTFPPASSLILSYPSYQTHPNSKRSISLDIFRS